MKKLLAAAIAASALTAAVPAMAQSYVNDYGSTIERRIDAGVREGSLSYGDASVLRSRLREIQRMQNRASLDGMSGWEAHQLNTRYDRLSDQLHQMRQSTGYSYRYRHRDDDDDLW